MPDSIGGWPASLPWSLVHGPATLWLNGSLPATIGDDPEAVTRAVAGQLFARPPLTPGAG